ncbi:MAG: glucose 1-dehydrogenase [Chloroflexota bacterium]
MSNRVENVPPLLNRVAVVTGASRGLGRAVAVALAAAGADVAVTARSLDGLRGVVDDVTALGRRAVPVACDVTSWDSVSALAELVADALGVPDVLVNNAGIVVESPLAETDPAEWQRLMDTNVNGVFYGCRAFGPAMIKRGGGVVINMSSAFGEMGVPGVVGYCASKAAVSQLSRALAVEWARYGVRVNAIAPGYIATDMTASLQADPEVAKHALRIVPQRRFGRPDEIGSLAVYLASDVSAFVTGEVITIDGGMTAR